MAGMTRDLARAVFQARDNRHNETHAALALMVQVLVEELAAQGVLDRQRLAERLRAASTQVAGDAHGDTARDMMAHLVDTLEQPARSPPPRWQVRPDGEGDDAAGQPGADRPVTGGTTITGGSSS